MRNMMFPPECLRSGLGGEAAIIMPSEHGKKWRPEKYAVLRE